MASVQLPTPSPQLPKLATPSFRSLGNVSFQPLKPHSSSQHHADAVAHWLPRPQKASPSCISSPRDSEQSAPWSSVQAHPSNDWPPRRFEITLHRGVGACNQTPGIIPNPGPSCRSKPSPANPQAKGFSGTCPVWVCGRARTRTTLVCWASRLPAA